MIPIASASTRSRYRFTRQPAFYCIVMATLGLGMSVYFLLAFDTFSVAEQRAITAVLFAWFWFGGRWYQKLSTPPQRHQG